MKIHPCFILFQSANLSFITIEGSQSVGDIGDRWDMEISWNFPTEKKCMVNLGSSHNRLQEAQLESFHIVTRQTHAAMVDP